MDKALSHIPVVNRMLYAIHAPRRFAARRNRLSDDKGA